MKKKIKFSSIKARKNNIKTNNNNIINNNHNDIDTNNDNILIQEEQEIEWKGEKKEKSRQNGNDLEQLESNIL